ncbi:MAG: hypothetical protein ACFFEF_05890 [Candidatus Thorarchaeota archaeon]
MGHISVKLPGSKIAAGWIERGIIAQGIGGHLGSKENQEKFAIPLSITMRFVVDRGIDSEGDSGILILGEKGSEREKFVVIFQNNFTERNVTKIISAFWLKSDSPKEILQLFTRSVLNHQFVEPNVEPPIDYVEYIRESASVLNCTEGFALEIPQNWKKKRNWIPETLQGDSTSSVLFKHKHPKDSISLALLLSNWIAEMNETLRVTNLVGACFFLRSDTIESFLWDGPRSILTSSIFGSSNFEAISVNTLAFLWESMDTHISQIDSKAIRSEDEPLPKERVVVPPEYERLASVARGLLGKIDIEDMFRRIERTEAILGELERASSTKPDEEKPKLPTHIESRLRDALDQLENLATRLIEMEQRIQAICNQLE